jgi:uncharacterized protein (DUF58 family)
MILLRPCQFQAWGNMRKGKWGLILLTIAAYVNAYILREKIPYIIFYTLLLSILISYLTCRDSVRKISGFQRIKQYKYETGDIIKIETVLDNDSIFIVPYLELRDKTLEKMGEGSIYSVMTIGPWKRKREVKNIAIKYRGVYTLGPIDLLIQDALRIFTWTKKIESGKNFKVYPKVYTIERLDLKALQSFGSISNRQLAFEDSTSISDIRKYVPGDSIKRVHWKLSAKNNKLYVKNFEKSGSTAVYLYIDLYKRAYTGEYANDLEERAAESACSITFYLMERAVPIELYLTNSNISFIKAGDMSHFSRVLDMMCQAKPNGDRVMEDIIEKRLDLMNRGASVIIITGDISGKAAALYCSMRENGYDLIIAYVNDGKLSNEKRKMLEACGIKLYMIKHDSQVGRCFN